MSDITREDVNKALSTVMEYGHGEIVVKVQDHKLVSLKITGCKERRNEGLNGEK